MNGYAIQHRPTGAYIAPRVGHHVIDPHDAFLFLTREAASNYIGRHLVRRYYTVATLPATRPLLSQPTEPLT